MTGLVNTVQQEAKQTGYRNTAGMFSVLQITKTPQDQLSPSEDKARANMFDDVLLDIAGKNSSANAPASFIEIKLKHLLNMSHDLLNENKRGLVPDEVYLAIGDFLQGRKAFAQSQKGQSLISVMGRIADDFQLNPAYIEKYHHIDKPEHTMKNNPSAPSLQIGKP